VNVPLKTASISLDTIERVALSLGSSLAIVPLIGILLYYTPWVSNITVITSTILGVTALLATGGLVREYQELKRYFLERITIVDEVELTEKTLKFQVKRGFIKNYYVVVKEIPLTEIASIACHDDELSVNFNGRASIFIVRQGQRCSTICDIVKSKIAQREK
jgi:uncharacterized membrane protein